MNKLPTTSDLSFLVGSQILQICLGANELIINFQDEISITATSLILFSIAGEVSQTESNKNSASLIAKFIQKTVKNVDVDDLGGLKIIFDKDDYFRILKSSEIYESYVVFNKGNYISY